tara:strand:+ start:261 stop:557 length:297 start_codon:yes stop_codon:yes gene_type:complete
MIAVLDTSAAVEVVLKRESATLFSHFLAEADLVIAPTLLITEATNVFWKYQQFSDYPYDECEKSIDHLSLYQMNMSMNWSFIESHSNWGVCWTIQSMT